MSHTLHRSGSEKSLSKDFVILIMPENGLNDQNSEEKLRKCFDILLKHNPVNTGDSKNGSRYSLGSDEEVLKRLEEKETIFAVYDNEKDLTDVLKELKDLDCGLSVVISGLFDRSCKCANEARPITRRLTMRPPSRTRGSVDVSVSGAGSRYSAFRLALSPVMSYFVIAYGLAPASISSDSFSRRTASSEAPPATGRFFSPISRSLSFPLPSSFRSLRIFSSVFLYFCAFLRSLESSGMLRAVQSSSCEMLSTSR